MCFFHSLMGGCNSKATANPLNPLVNQCFSKGLNKGLCWSFFSDTMVLCWRHLVLSISDKEILIPTTLNFLWSTAVVVVKVDYFDFPCEIFEILCKKICLRIIACNFWIFWNFFCSNSFIFEPKVEKNMYGCYSTQ